MSKASEQADAVQSVMTATNGASEVVKLEALAKIPAPTGGAADRLWALLVFILGVLLILGLFAIYRLTEQKIAAEPIIGLFTTVLAGLIGLFAPSPVKAAAK